MISNEVQYKATVAHLRQFEQALANLAADSPRGKRTKLQRLETDAFAAQADDLRAEIAEYQQLRSGRVSTLEAATLGDLASVLIRARIARGMTQGQLAEALGVAEQQIQRYEASGYRSASLARICDIAEALHIDIAQVAHLRHPNAA
ncbi:MAG: helix-turn-helix domain-containing protein [Actinomycetota bacterium]|nr:helix-turn-helix domain-containing protein [Actinomycetota bacterium]